MLMILSCVPFSNEDISVLWLRPRMYVYCYFCRVFFIARFVPFSEKVRVACLTRRKWRHFTRVFKKGG